MVLPEYIQERTRKSLKEKDIIVIDDVVPGTPAYGFLDKVSHGLAFREGFYYQDHGKFSPELLKTHRRNGNKLENPEDLAEVLRNPETGHFYNASIAKYSPKDEIIYFTEMLEMPEEEFRRRTGVGSHDSAIIMSRLPEEESDFVFLHEFFHSQEGNILFNNRALNSKYIRHAYEKLTDMRAITWYPEDREVCSSYVSRNAETHDKIREIFNRYGNPFEEMIEILDRMRENLHSDPDLEKLVSEEMLTWNGTPYLDPKSPKENRLKAFERALNLCIGRNPNE